MIIFLLSACSTQDISGAGTSLVMLTLAPLAPIIDGYHAVSGTKKALGAYEVYKIKESVYVLRNEFGWFTDQSERKTGESRRYLSAWVVDLDSSKKDANGRIVLSENNLERWFFKDFDSSLYSLMPRNKIHNGCTCYSYNAGDEYMTLYTENGKPYVIILKQS